jgi:hypothetical protein
MRVIYGNPTEEDISSDSFAHGLFRWVVRHPLARANQRGQDRLVSKLSFRSCCPR